MLQDITGAGAAAAGGGVAGAVGALVVAGVAIGAGAASAGAAGEELSIVICPLETPSWTRSFGTQPLSPFLPVYLVLPLGQTKAPPPVGVQVFEPPA
jgi:hypothetical protein